MGLQYQLPADTVLEVSYGGSRGLKLFAFYNGNQEIPSANASDPSAPRRPAHQVTPGAPAGDECSLDAFYNNPSIYNCNPALDATIATFRSNTQSNYNSLQVRLEKRYSHGLQYEAAYTYSHALDNASSASLGSVNNGDFQDQRFPNQNYGNADFDVRHRFVFSYVYDLPFGRGKRFAGNASGVVNQILGDWQMSGVFSHTTGNYYTATDIESVANADCGGTVGYNCARPTSWVMPTAPLAYQGRCSTPALLLHNTDAGNIRQCRAQYHRGPRLHNLGHFLGQTVSNIRANASRIPRGVLQHTEPRQLFVWEFWRNQRRADATGTGSERPRSVRLRTGRARPAADPIRVEVLLLEKTSRRDSRPGCPTRFSVLPLPFETEIHHLPDVMVQMGRALQHHIETVTRIGARPRIGF